MEDSFFGELTYAVGEQFVLLCRRTAGFFVKYIAAPLKRFAVFIGTFFSGLFRDTIRKMKKGFSETLGLVKEYGAYFSGKNGVKFRDFASFEMKKHGSLFRYIGNTAVLIAVIIAVAASAMRLDNYTVALKVEHNGCEVGYAENESAFYAAKGEASKRLALASGECGELSYSMCFVPVTGIDSVSDIAKNIIASSDTPVENACGVYIDGKFICASDSRSSASEVFDRVLSPYREKEADSNFAFVENVTFDYGLYPTDSSVKWSSDKLYNYLTSGKKPLTVKQMKADVYTESVDFDTVKINSGALYVGTTSVLKDGEDGLDRVTRLTTYVDGKETESAEISRIPVKSAVSERIAVGTRVASVMKYTRSFGGVFLWPAPDNCFSLSSGYGYRNGAMHSGIDIVSSSDGSCKGRPIVAAAPGIVVAAEYHYSWGYYVKIDHGGGVMTLYAHSMKGSFLVSEGDYVAAGQQIASIGTTGNSTGYHLHFEVWIDGTRVNPLPYVYSEAIEYLD